MPPLVTAIIPTKNRADLLSRALQSVLDQTYSDLEIVVVNDGSTDRTSKLLLEYKEKIGAKLSIIENSESVGAAQARNQAIEVAAGRFIAGLDDDDTWHPERISKLISANQDNYSCVTSDTVMVYSDFKAAWRKQKLIDLDTLLYTNQVGNQVLVEKDRLIAVGGFDTSLPAAQDYDLWVRLCEKYGPIRNVQEPLQTIYMDHESERITDRSSFEGYLQFYQKHKKLMDDKQKRYQIYKIRRAQDKPESVGEFLRCVPGFRYWKELKRIVINIFLK